MPIDQWIMSISSTRLPYHALLLPDQRDLQVGRPVLLDIKAAAVDVASAPEQELTPEVDEVVLHEIRSLLEAEGDKRLAEDALGRIDSPRSVSRRGDLIEHVGKSLRERSDLVAFIGNKIDLLRAGSDRVGALPKHVPDDPDARERHGSVGIGGVDDIELEPVGRQIIESAREIERLQ